MIDEPKGSEETQQSERHDGKPQPAPPSPDAATANAETKNTDARKQSTEGFFKVAYDWAKLTLWPRIKPIFSNSAAWTAVATIAIFIATCAYVHYAKKQWTAMESQISQMQKMLDNIQDQNWIGRNAFRAERPVFTQKTQLSPMIGKPSSLKATVGMENVGHTVAVDMHTSTKIWVADSDVFTSSVGYTPCQTFGFVAPDSKVACETAPIDSTPDEIKAYELAHKRLYVFVYTYYGENIEKNSWITQNMCMFYTFGDALDHLTDCPEGNVVWENNNGREIQNPPPPPEGAPPAQAPKK